MTAVSKHQLIIIDKELCDDPNLYDIVNSAFTSTLLLANHIGLQYRSIKLGSLAICVAEFEEDGIDFKAILSPIVPATSTIGEITASMNLFVSKEDKKSLKIPTESQAVEIEWSELIALLIPFIHYPPQEGFRISFISKRSISLTDFIQQPNCLSFQFVKATSINLSHDERIFQGPMAIQKKEIGLEFVAIPPVKAEWEMYYKLCIFDQVLAPTFPMIIHFSTSIYSKLIISCKGKMRALSLCNNLDFTPDSTAVFETVSKVKRNGICQSLISSQPIMVMQKPFKEKGYLEANENENQLRFKTALRALHEEEAVLIVKTMNPSNIETVKKIFALMPCYEEGYFLMVSLTPSELLVPEIDIEDFTNEAHEYSDIAKEEENLSIEMEVNSALKKVSFNDFYNPMEHHCEIKKILEAQHSKVRGKKTEALINRTVTPSRGRGRGRGSGRGKSGKLSKFQPIVKSTP